MARAIIAKDGGSENMARAIIAKDGGPENMARAIIAKDGGVGKYGPAIRCRSPGGTASARKRPTPRTKDPAATTTAPTYARLMKPLGPAAAGESIERKYASGSRIAPAGVVMRTNCLSDGESAASST